MIFENVSGSATPRRKVQIISIKFFAGGCAGVAPELTAQTMTQPNFLANHYITAAIYRLEDFLEK